MEGAVPKRAPSGGKNSSFKGNLMKEFGFIEFAFISTYNKIKKMLVKMNLDDHWNPNLKVSNALLFYLTKVSSALFFKSRKQAMARLLMRVRALFPIHFSAATFPFEEVVSLVFGY